VQNRLGDLEAPLHRLQNQAAAPSVVPRVEGTVDVVNVELRRSPRRDTDVSPRILHALHLDRSSRSASPAEDERRSRSASPNAH
jgi:hypothetical protein